MDDRLTIVRAKLSPTELKAYDDYLEKGAPSLAPSVQLQLYQLFLNGKSTDEIARLNPNFSLGMIVRARVEGFWDEKRDAHLAQLLEGVRERVQQAQLEAVNFACDMLSAVHKLQGDKIKKYLQTGNQEELEGLGGNLSLKTYKEVVELLLKLTGQDSKDKKVSGEVLHKHTVEAGPGPVGKAGFSPAKAARILELIESEEAD